MSSVSSNVPPSLFSHGVVLIGFARGWRLLASALGQCEVAPGRGNHVAATLRMISLVLHCGEVPGWRDVVWLPPRRLKARRRAATSSRARRGRFDRRLQRQRRLIPTQFAALFSTTTRPAQRRGSIQAQHPSALSPPLPCVLRLHRPTRRSVSSSSPPTQPRVLYGLA